MVGSFSSPGLSVNVRRRLGRVDHIFISCLECEFVGEWIPPDNAMFYQADLNMPGAIVKLVDFAGTRKIIQFKRGAYVTLLPNTE